MSDVTATIGGQRAEAASDWTASWREGDAGLVRLANRHRSELALVEGSGSDWIVTLRGRRIHVTVQTWRERVLAEAESAVGERSGPVDVRATLPGLVVAVAVAEGDEVEEGATLLTIEAMKMQNEVRSPRAGRIATITAEVGRPVAAGAELLRIE